MPRRAISSLVRILLLLALTYPCFSWRCAPSLKVEAASAAVAATHRWEVITHRAYLEFAIDGKRIGRVQVGLFGNAVPRTVQNFLKLARNEGVGDAQGRGRGYRDTPSHRIIPGFMAQMGDTTLGNGMGGVCADGKPRMPDENFKVKHVGRGYLSMANAGPHTGSSQFFILFKEAPWLDGKHVVFGRVLDDASLQVLQRLEQVGTPAGTPKKRVMIVDCGELTAQRADKKTEL